MSLCKKIEYIQKFGAVKNEFRGSNTDKLMNPPIEVTDNYHWIRDDERKNQDVLDLINNENKYSDDILKNHQDLKKSIYQEIKSYIKEEYDSYAFLQGDPSPYKYFTRFLEGKDYHLECRLNVETDEIKVLLDINKLAEGKSQCDVSTFEVSPNHKYISYGVDYDGSEKYDFNIMDIETNTFLVHNIPKLMYCSYFWASSTKIYYSLADDRNRMNQICMYDLETNTNTIIITEPNEEHSLSAEISNDKKFIFITIGDYETKYSYVIDFVNDPINYKLFSPLVKGEKYYLNHHQDYFYILTNRDNSTNWKIMRVKDIDTPWEEFIPYNKHIYISDLQVFVNYLVYKTKINGNIFLNVYDFKEDVIEVISHLDNKVYTKKEYCELNHELLKSYHVYTIDFGINNIYETDTLNITFTSLTEPNKLIDYNMNTLEHETVYIKNVPNYDESLYECKRLWIPSESVHIPVSIMYRKDKFVQDGTMPLFLYGYGSYGYTIDTNFNYKILPLVDRGYIYAIAHVRGGAFLGYDWYLQGKMYNKLNTFNDFTKCAEYFISESYTSIKNIVIEGRSAGGLLVGASVTMKPELFKTVILGVPFIDVLNTMSDSTIPLTIEEWTQWGNPNEEKDYLYMKKYCPYTNIKKTDYPNMYLSGGLHDPRVPYWEPLKFLAKIREYKTDTNTQIIRMETSQGHFGGSSRYKFIDELAEKYVFIFTR